ncbi:MAG: hypothetical protein PVG49_13295 [Desulfobacteraceae bacterium]|jgi:hypothetical protein
MREVREKISESLTRGASPRGVATQSTLLALAATLSALPYFHSLLWGPSRVQPSIPQTGLWQLLAGQAMLLFLVCFLSSMAGLAFAPRQGLPGWGDPLKLRNELGSLVLLGLGMAVVSYVGFDRRFFPIAPFAYPQTAFQALSLPFKGALTEEVILRLCMVTLAVGILKRPWAGVLLIATLAPFLSIKYFRFIGIDPLPGGLLAMQWLVSFGANVLLGVLFVKRGLLFCMVIKFVYSLKYGLILLLAG